MMIGWEIDPSVAAQSPKSEEFARLWQRAQKIVFSSSLHEVSTERTRIERTFNPETVGEIKASVDHDPGSLWRRLGVHCMAYELD
jgi:hypothetical protein